MMSVVPSSGVSTDASSCCSRGSSAPTPAGRRRQSALGAAEGRIDDWQGRLATVRQSGAQDLASAKASLESVFDTATRWQHNVKDADRKAELAWVELQDGVRERLRALELERVRAAGMQAAAAGEAAAGLQGELGLLEELLPDVGGLAAELDQIRDGLEGERLLRREASEVAARALEGRLRGARLAVDEECAALDGMRDGFQRHLSNSAAELRGMLEEGRRERLESHVALSEVVYRMRASLEAGALEEIDPLPPISLPSTLASGLSGLFAKSIATPTASTSGRSAAEAKTAHLAGASPEQSPRSWRAESEQSRFGLDAAQMCVHKDDDDDRCSSSSQTVSPSDLAESCAP
mmetsp:Transcript_106141/g.269555  ORF Transcript_106141/g.269555 Transcript_106141/m.269555 type:complete len:350 (-) Transcript_106141:95-1144(-)